MIKFDWDKQFPQDFEVPLNMVAAILQEDKILDIQTLSATFNTFAESYLHAGDIIFQEYMNFLSGDTENYPHCMHNMFGVIYRLYAHAIETKLKSLIYAAGDEPKKEHKFSQLINSIESKYILPENSDGYFKFISSFDEYSSGSQLGRYPVDKNNKVLGRVDEGYVMIANGGGIATWVYHIHELFENIFPNMTLK